MYKPVQQCTNCGAGLSLDDLRKQNCTYCGVVYPHHAQAAQHAAVVGQVMNQMVQNQMAMYGQSPFVPPAYGAGPPGGMAPYQQPGGPANAYGNPNAYAQVHA